MIIRDPKHYWVKHFRAKIFFGILISLIPLTLVFTNIFLYAKILIVFISLFSFSIFYILHYKNYKSFCSTLSLPAKKIKINLFEEKVHLDNGVMKIHQIQFCDDATMEKIPCDYSLVQTSNMSNIDCIVFDDDHSKFMSIINADETILIVVKKKPKA